MYHSIMNSLILALVGSTLLGGMFTQEIKQEKDFRVTRHPPAFRTHGTRAPPELIGRFQSSPAPSVYKHFTKLPPVQEKITFPPIWNTRSPSDLLASFEKSGHPATKTSSLSSNLKVKPFTISPSGPLSPYIGKTSHPLNEVKKPYSHAPPNRETRTKAPSVREELFHHGGVTFPAGAITHKITRPPLGRKTFSPIELSRNSYPTSVPPSPQSDIYSWAPVKFPHVSKKPHGTNTPQPQ